MGDKREGVGCIFVRGPVTNEGSGRLLFERIRSTFEVVSSRVVIRRAYCGNRTGRVTTRCTTGCNGSYIIISYKNSNAVRRVTGNLTRARAPVVVLPFNANGSFTGGVCNDGGLSTFGIIGSFNLRGNGVGCSIGPVSLVSCGNRGYIGIVDFKLSAVIRAVNHGVTNGTGFLNRRTCGVTILPTLVRLRCRVGFRVSITSGSNSAFG